MRRNPVLFPFKGMLILLLLQSFWFISQHEAVTGSWWGVLFVESGPYVLPIIFGVVLLLTYGFSIGQFLSKRVKLMPVDVSFLFFVFYAWLTVPIAYLNHFETTKIWKDVAFASTFLLVPIVRSLGSKRIEGLTYAYLVVSFLAGLLGLAEAVRREVFVYQAGFSHFLLWTYRVIAGGHFNETLFALGYLVLARGQRIKVRLSILVLFSYFAFRFGIYFTRLNWISGFLALLLFVAFILPRHFRDPIIRYVMIFVVVILVTSVAVLMVTSSPITTSAHPLYQRFSSLSNPLEDVSVRFRLVESQMLFQRFLRYPLAGWGPGGTISPNVPEEPTRNEISVFFNGYLGLLYKFGVVGVLPLFLGISLTLLKARVFLRGNGAPYSKAIVGGWAMLLVGIIIATVFSDGLFANLNGTTVSLAVGSISRLNCSGALQNADRD